MKNENIYYVYVWIRKDINKIFYVGKGKKNRYKDLSSRNQWFLNIVNKIGMNNIEIKIIENNLTEELVLLDTADITTFDAYALALVKKYHYYLNLSKNINIIDSSVMEIFKRDTLERIFNDLYEKEEEKFLQWCEENS